jgi:hypothetical protein
VSLIVEIRRDPGTATVVLRPYPIWSRVGVFALVALIAGLLGFAVAPSSTLAGMVRLGLVLTMGLAAYGALLASAWYGFGREIVTATRTALVIEHRVLRPRRKVTTYAADRVQDLREVGLGQVMRRGRPVSAIASALAFDYEGRNVRFGAGLAGAEAESVIAALNEAMQPTGKTVSSAK